MSTYSEKMQQIWKQYEDAGMPVPATKTEVAAWAIKNGLWQPKPTDVIAQCADDLGRALREEYRTAPDGGRYRAKHVVRIKSEGKQRFLWADIDTAPREHMVKAFAQRRRQVVGDCHQLKVDVDYYNSSKSAANPIQIVLDFTDDVEELLHLERMEKAG